jgi:phage baseplate assembly protein V
MSWHRVVNMISRAVVVLVNDVLKGQALQVQTSATDYCDNVERLQNYGFSSVPLPGAEAIVLHVGATADHPVAVVVDDRRTRPTALLPGDVVVWDTTGQRIHLTAARVVVQATGTIELAGTSAVPLDPLTTGVVQGQCIDMFTGQPFASLGQTSSVVLAKKV